MRLLYLTLIIFCTLKSFNCNSQKHSDGSKEDFLKWLLKKREEQTVSKKTVPLDFGIFKDLSNEIKLSAKDSAEIKVGMEENNNSGFNYNNFVRKTFVGDSTISEMTKKTAYLFLKISRPIFFDHNNKILIFIENHCGDNCGSGMVEIYTIDKSGYSLLFNKLIWIS
jgi:hypothetical protein